MPLALATGIGIDLRLRRPLEERVLFGEIDNFLAGHYGIGESRGHRVLYFQIVSFAN